MVKHFFVWTLLFICKCLNLLLLNLAGLICPWLFLWPRHTAMPASDKSWIRQILWHKSGLIGLSTLLVIIWALSSSTNTASRCVQVLYFVASCSSESSTATLPDCRQNCRRLLLIQSNLIIVFVGWFRNVTDGIYPIGICFSVSLYGNVAKNLYSCRCERVCYKWACRQLPICRAYWETACRSSYLPVLLPLVTKTMSQP